MVFLVIEIAFMVKYGKRVVETYQQYRENEARGAVLAIRILIFILLLTAAVLLDITLWPSGKES